VLRVLLILINSFLLLTLFYFSQLFPVKFFHMINSDKFDKLLILSIIKVESNFNPYAESHVGAYGLMQILPSTAQWLNEKFGLNLDYKVPEDNLKLGIFYLDYLYNNTKDLEEALVFYNTGPNASEEIKKYSGERYLKKIKNAYLIYKLLYWSDQYESSYFK